MNRTIKNREMSDDISLLLYLVDCLDQLLYAEVRVDILGYGFSCVSPYPIDFCFVFVSL